MDFETVLGLGLTAVAIILILAAVGWAFHKFILPQLHKDAAAVPLASGGVVPPVARPNAREMIANELERQRKIDTFANPVVPPASRVTSMPFVVSMAPPAPPPAPQVIPVPVPTPAFVAGRYGSNSPDPTRWPQVDPATGYGLFYPLGANKEPVAAAWFSFDGTTFQTVADIETYKAALRVHNDNLAQWEKDFYSPGVGYTLFPAAIEDQALAAFDAEPNEAIRWFQISDKEASALISRFYHGGDGNPRVTVRQLINQYNGGAQPEGYYASPVFAYRQMQKS
jgi:hypothetical protein